MIPPVAVVVGLARGVDADDRVELHAVRLAGGDRRWPDGSVLGVHEAPHGLFAAQPRRRLLVLAHRSPFGWPGPGSKVSRPIQRFMGRRRLLRGLRVGHELLRMS